MAATTVTTDARSAQGEWLPYPLQLVGVADHPDGPYPVVAHLEGDDHVDRAVQPEHDARVAVDDGRLDGQPPRHLAVEVDQPPGYPPGPDDRSPRRSAVPPTVGYQDGVRRQTAHHTVDVAHRHCDQELVDDAAVGRRDPP